MTAHLATSSTDVVHVTQQNSGQVHTNNGHPIVGTKNDVTGQFPATEAADVAAANGPVGLIGTLAVLEAADTAAVAGRIEWLASMAATETADVFASAGIVASAGECIGILSATEDSDSAAIAGIVVLQDITGTLVATEAADVAAFTDGRSGIVGGIYFAPRRPIFQEITGALAATEAADHVFAFGYAGHPASLRYAGRSPTLLVDLSEDELLILAEAA